jgi:hypothetical protein
MYDKLIDHLLKEGAWKVTYFASPKNVIRATRTTLRKKFTGKDIEITISICKPNYLEREWVKKMHNEVKGLYYFKYLPKKKQPVRK